MRKLTLTLRCLVDCWYCADRQTTGFGFRRPILEFKFCYFPAGVILMKTLYLPWPQFLIYKLLVVDLE